MLGRGEQLNAELAGLVGGEGDRERALAEAAKLSGQQHADGMVVDLEQYARIARVAGR